ncbi:MAG: hypothetical protein ACRDZX_09025 [Acidimicrobiales bacterium]
MGAALALAIMLVVVVAILSLAVNAQGPFQGVGQGGRAARSERSSRGASPGAGQPAPGKPQRRSRARGERDKERAGAGAGAPEEKEPTPLGDADQLLGELRPLNSEASAVVISVVDERTVGPVTRSRLTLRVQPAGDEAFEVATRVAFPTPEERAKVKVGATIPVRYDSDDHRRVVVDMEKGPGS